MREIPLTQGYTTRVDDADFEELSKHRWRALVMRRGGMVQVYANTHIGGSCVLMHRLITGATDGELVDHQDHDTLNNQRANLRQCSVGQNNANRVATGATRIKGVVRVKSRIRPWRAQIRIDGQTLHLGNFQTAKEAADAYDAAARKHFGEFAFTNNLTWSATE